MKHCLITLTLAAFLWAPMAMGGMAMGEMAPNEMTNEQNDDTVEGSVHRAQFTTALEDREPMDDLDVLEQDVERVIFFTEIRDMAETTLTHRWSHDGELVSDVELEIGSPRWRTWSSKTLTPDLAGEWTVSVLDEDGDEMGSWSFEYAPE
ncbi:hypothetical protein J2T60_002311 [Natronospira proteinivora]|uniref:DUF2914 domain-containing protein n=1 Tax=Natronospira proteinivora TaxID=1807133 RepID=A0ABT1GAL2_9GAMM|nr:DUF2914 domain-containing protein [Natronospira proteinivora]MCP1728311.1 hypothetical protein [Natronospira proteinivora]